MENPYRNRENCPNIQIGVSKEDYIIYIICKAGWFNGNPTIAYNSPIDDIMKAYQFEMFSRDYKNTLMEMNKE